MNKLRLKLIISFDCPNAKDFFLTFHHSPYFKHTIFHTIISAIKYFIYWNLLLS